MILRSQGQRMLRFRRFRQFYVCRRCYREPKLGVEFYS